MEASWKNWIILFIQPLLYLQVKSKAHLNACILRLKFPSDLANGGGGGGGGEHRRSQEFWLGGAIPVADLENFGGGDFKHKPSKIRMSSPKLRVIFGPESKIQTFFSAQNQVVSKTKKKVFTKIEGDFSAETVSFTVTLLLNYCYVRNYWKKNCN